jgi:hypothetical protein
MKSLPRKTVRESKKSNFAITPVLKKRMEASYLNVVYLAEKGARKDGAIQ